MEKHDQGASLIEDQAATWLARRDGDGWTAAAQRDLDKWLDADVRHRVAFLRLQAAWRKADTLTQSAMPARPTLVRGRVLSAGGWRMVAGLLLTCSLGGLFMWSRETETQRYVTRVGENRAVALADGSRIVLNTATRLRAARDGTRHVWLDRGEAYFDVAHDPAHPFVIESGSSRVTVLGTRFTVRRDGDVTAVLVAQGRVRVAEKGRTVELARNEEATARAGAIVSAAHTPTETEQRLAWRDGRLVFDRMTLAEAAAEFNRYNERQLVIADPVIGRTVIGGSFAPTNVDGFVRLLEEGFALRAQRNGDVIRISR
jgi:transmembrane sensor